MSWLRPRKRSVDIITSTKAQDLEQHNNDDAVNTGKEGKYISVQHIFVDPTEEEEEETSSTTYMNGVLSSETDGDFDKLQHLEQTDNINTNQKDLKVFGKKGENQADIAFNQILQDSIDDSQDMMKIEQLDINNCNDNMEHTEHANIDDTAIEDDKYSHNKDCHSDQSEEHDGDEEERDIYSDENRNIITYQKYMGRPRHSLDSQLELLPKSNNPKMSSLDSLNEDGDLNGSMDINEQSNTAPQKKKSISWASDLETIHEFHKIKGRKLSLSALFKKY